MEDTVPNTSFFVNIPNKLLSIISSISSAQFSRISNAYKAILEFEIVFVNSFFVVVVGVGVIRNPSD